MVTIPVQIATKTRITNTTLNIVEMMSRTGTSRFESTTLPHLRVQDMGWPYRRAIDERRRGRGTSYSVSESVPFELVPSSPQQIDDRGDTASTSSWHVESWKLVLVSEIGMNGVLSPFTPERVLRDLDLAKLLEIRKTNWKIAMPVSIHPRL